MDKFSIGSSISVEVLPADLTTKEIVEKYQQEDKESYFSVDLGTVVQKHRQWQSHLPRVVPFYAIKCNDDPILVRLLAGLGVGFDCASKIEIKTVLGLGVSPSRIVYANPCKFKSHLEYAAKEGCSLMTYDNKPELDKIKKIYPNAQLLLRIRADDPDAICQLGVKFGADPANAESLLQRAKDLELDVVGVSFHVGSGCQNASAFSAAVAKADKVFSIGEELGFNFKILDIGGGFPGTDSVQISFEEIACELNGALDKYFPESRDVNIIAEPGRFYASACSTLAVTVSSIRDVDQPDGTSSYMYYVSDGVYGSFNCILFDHAEVFPKVAGRDTEQGSSHNCSIWGPTCDSMDVILKESKLPQLEIGDILYFEDMGAYTKSASSTFNGYNKPECFYYVTTGYRDTVQRILAPFTPATDRREILLVAS